MDGIECARALSLREDQRHPTPPVLMLTAFSRGEVQQRLAERRVAVGGIDRGAHLLERVDHPAHRPPGKRAIANQLRLELLPGEDAREHPHRGAGIAGVERAVRRTKGAKPSSHQSDRVGQARHLHTEGGQAGEGGPAVGARCIVAQLRSPPGQGRQQRISVGDRLVAGDADSALEAPCRRHRRRSD